MTVPLTAEDAIATLETLLAEEHVALCEMHAARVGALAAEKETWFKNLVDSGAFQRPELRPRLRQLHASMQKNALLISYARDLTRRRSHRCRRRRSQRLRPKTANDHLRAAGPKPFDDGLIMASLFNVLNIANSSLIAQTAGLNVTSNNVANATTPGYVKQTAVLSDQVLGSQLGGGRLFRSRSPVRQIRILPRRPRRRASRRGQFAFVGAHEFAVPPRTELGINRFKTSRRFSPRPKR